MNNVFFWMLLFFFNVSVYSQQAKQICNKVFENLDLYPIVSPYEEGFLQVSPMHNLYYAQFGNPKGVPVLILHGGPGAGCDEWLTALFDVSYYRIIMVDQRGARRSQPFAEMQENRSDLLVEDMEIVRRYLEIDKWFLFGGSWGSALALLYGETYPERVLGFILRGIFLARKQDYEHIFYGMKQFFPEIWQSLTEPFLKESDNLINVFYNKIMDPDPSVHMPLAHSFMYYDTVAGTFSANPDLIPLLDDQEALSVARAFIHYSAHSFFLRDNQILDNVHKIAHLPVIMVQGRYDMICPPHIVYDLYVKLDNAQLWFIPEGGHFISNHFIARGLKEATDSIKKDKLIL